jgi:coniferyl-aldehyde dehydrogenase
MKNTLELQKRKSLLEGTPDLGIRLDRLNRLLDMMISYQDQIPVALSKDFGHRSPMASKFTDIASVFDAIHFAKKHLKKWMKPEQRSAGSPFNFLGAKAYIQYQPLGTVGVISPWNFPFNLTFAPLAGILSAGNRTMIKPSEITPESSNLMKKMVSEFFDPDELALFCGDVSVAEAFSKLPFDHLLFTGSTSVAKHVMRSAAENLVPVTLELGGKSPVILGSSANMKLAADRVWNGKLLNSGQICLAPDYLFVHEDHVESWIQASIQSIAEMFPSFFDNDDYTSIINERHFKRLLNYLDDAEKKGARLIEFNPAKEDEEDRTYFKMLPTIILGVNEDMLVMQEEIFGPIIPIKTYSKIEDTVDYVNGHERPLGLYYFGNDKTEEAFILNNTISGGVTLNDVVFHVSQEDIPFGGIGPSGMGHYHGLEGFKRFSHAKSIYKQSSIDTVVKLTRPPFTDFFDRLITSRIKK